MTQKQSAIYPTEMLCPVCGKANLVKLSQSCVNNDMGWCPKCGSIQDTFRTWDLPLVPVVSFHLI
jgi:predicted RNA-binding Zn-ribbon protein involved in translation (DUF1610 family)